MLNIYELFPRYDARKSFYGKAHIIETSKLKNNNKPAPRASVIFYPAIIAGFFCVLRRFIYLANKQYTKLYKNALRRIFERLNHIHIVIYTV